MGLSIKEILNMPYADFISMIRETNRCPGGKATIRWIVQNAFINAGSKILEIGCTTGFTSLEIARISGASMIGIDIAQTAIQTANSILQSDTPAIQKLVKFERASVLKLPYPDESFNMVITGGSLSFLEDKIQAIKEIIRVMKPWGMLSITNLFYKEKPPKKLLEALKKIIGIEIKPWNKQDYINFYLQESGFEYYTLHEGELQPVSDQILFKYVNSFMDKPHIAQLEPNVKEVISERWKHILTVFNQNHHYLGYFSLLLRKRLELEEDELFKIK